MTLRLASASPLAAARGDEDARVGQAIRPTGAGFSFFFGFYYPPEEGGPHPR